MQSKNLAHFSPLSPTLSPGFGVVFTIDVHNYINIHEQGIV